MRDIVSGRKVISASDRSFHYLAVGALVSVPAIGGYGGAIPILLKNYFKNLYLETAKKLLAARGDFSKVDWSDVLVSTSTSKLGFGGKAAGEVVNGLVDLSWKGGFKSTLLGTKDGAQTLTDLMFSFIKTGVGEIGNATIVNTAVGDAGKEAAKLSVDFMKAVFDQLKASLKQEIKKADEKNK